MSGFSSELFRKFNDLALEFLVFDPTKRLYNILAFATAQKVMTYAGVTAPLVRALRLAITCAAGPPSKKNDIGTSNISANCCSRLALTRLVPFSYFWICWKVRPTASPRLVWLIASMSRRIRIRAPTCSSVGLGPFLFGIPPPRWPAHESELP